MINDEEITDKKDVVVWEPHILQHKIFDKLYDAPATEVQLNSLVMTTGTANELFDLVASLKMPQDGLKKFQVFTAEKQ